ncbi:MAG: hypothetical protein K2X66_17035 [Cyanobacteria bacterium]|nr:hypothetical protein [Cyanobacteriota bacterium]
MLFASPYFVLPRRTGDIAPYLSSSGHSSLKSAARTKDVLKNHAQQFSGSSRTKSYAFKLMRVVSLLLGLFSVPVAANMLHVSPVRQNKSPEIQQNITHSALLPQTPYIPGQKLSFEEFETWTQMINHQADQKMMVIDETQNTFNAKLQLEFLPALKTILDPKITEVEVLLGSDHSAPHWEDFTMDGGRGLPVIHRYRLNVSQNPNQPEYRRMSLITFLEYNPQRHRFEIINAQDGTVNDAFRILVETASESESGNKGFMGASFQALVNQGKIIGIQPIRYYTSQGGVAPANPRGKIMPDELKPSHCIQCHGRKEDSFFRANYEFKRPEYKENNALQKFSTALQTQQIPNTEHNQVIEWLKAPTQHKANLIPAGLLQTLFNQK